MPDDFQGLKDFMERHAKNLEPLSAGPADTRPASSAASSASEVVMKTEERVHADTFEFLPSSLNLPRGAETFVKTGVAGAKKTS